MQECEVGNQGIYTFNSVIVALLISDKQCDSDAFEGIYALVQYSVDCMETFFALLAICAGNSPVTGEFPSQRPVTRIFDVCFDLHLNKRFSKQPRRWWFETPPRSLWRHCNVTPSSDKVGKKGRLQGQFHHLRTRVHWHSWNCGSFRIVTFQFCYDLLNFHHKEITKCARF